jgi:4-hydroxybenzoate polyprenyltransferase
MAILSNIGASGRIMVDVVAYRIRKREMANLFAALSIMIALHNELLDLTVRLLFAFFLNVLVYLVNDYYDVDIDMQAESRDRAKVVFLKDHLPHARGLILVLTLVLAGWAAATCPGLLLPLLGGVGICWFYSARLKHLPFLDVLAMIFWGGIMPTTGIFLDSTNGWLLVIQLALFSSCFETIQTLRDRESDARAGMTTTAVYLGERRTRLLLRILFLVNALYGILALHRIFGLFLLVAILLPVRPGRMNEYWNRVRLIFGLVWLATLIQFYLYDSPLGLFYAKLLLP